MHPWQQRLPCAAAPAPIPFMSLSNEQEAGSKPRGSGSTNNKRAVPFLVADDQHSNKCQKHCDQESLPASRTSSQEPFRSKPDRPAKDAEAASLLLGLSPVSSPKGPVPFSAALPEMLSLCAAEQSSLPRSGNPSEAIQQPARPTPQRQIVDGTRRSFPPLSHDSPRFLGIPMVRNATSGLSVSGCLSLLDIPDSAFASRGSPLVPQSAAPASAAAPTAAPDVAAPATASGSLPL